MAKNRKDMKTEIKQAEKINITPAHSTFLQRTRSLFIMFGGFFLIIFMGHFYTSLLVIGCSSRIFYEIMMLKKFETKGDHVYLQTKIAWYFYIVTVSFVLTTYFEDLRILISDYTFIDMVSY